VMFFYFSFLFCSENPDEIQIWIEQLFKLWQLVLSEEFKVKNTKLLTIIDNPAKVVFFYIFQEVKQKLQLRCLLIRSLSYLLIMF